MWLKWFPWRFLVRRMARAQGFLDPVALVSRLQRFSQPSEVMAPTELLRAGAVLQARGLINSQAIQHNLDWIWPYWVERQFNPKDDAFVPRAFNLSHINLTNRNWTAVGLPDSGELPIVDPRGLLTPFYDGWSLDGWVISENRALLPSRLEAHQSVLLDNGLAVQTETRQEHASLISVAQMSLEKGRPVCRLELTAESSERAWLVVSLRPCNPEGVSLIHTVERLEDGRGWKVNGRQFVYFSVSPDRTAFSEYKDGDVFRKLPNVIGQKRVQCDVGMATAAALFEIEPRERRHIVVGVPYHHRESPPVFVAASDTRRLWTESLSGHCKLNLPDKHMQRLYETALRTVVLHSATDIYPGPYTYKRFWFRDATFILHAMLCAGLYSRAERAIDRFPSRQTPFGYFLSQEGEWDSNGEALWAMRRFCELTGSAPKPSWKNVILKAGKWIQRKRLPGRLNARHAGLLPAGFSAEHLGPNDYYYWDNFWGCGGLEAAARLCELLGESQPAAEFARHAEGFRRVIEQSLKNDEVRLRTKAMPASPYRRLDAGSVGSLAAGYPLQIWATDDKRLKATADFLIERYFVDGGFFQEISHSGINPYLTLHVAQVLLRAGDPRFYSIMKVVADLASPTGQWPEAVHPRTRGGCMGDGQHVWAAAEWMLMIRNCFLREERGNRLVIGSGLTADWLKKGQKISFGPAPCSYGVVTIEAETGLDGRVTVSWQGQWRGHEPVIEVRLPGRETVRPEHGSSHATVGGAS